MATVPDATLQAVNTLLSAVNCTISDLKSDTNNEEKYLTIPQAVKEVNGVITQMTIRRAVWAKEIGIKRFGKKANARILLLDKSFWNWFNNILTETTDWEQAHKKSSIISKNY